MTWLAKIAAYVGFIFTSHHAPVLKPVSPAVPLIGHVQVIQELKERFAARQAAQQSAKKNDTDETPTQAYLKIGKKRTWRDIFRKLEKHEKYQRKYPALVAQVIKREKEFADTHYAFYHAHTISHMIFHDAIKEIYSYLHVYRPAHFNFLRFRELQQVHFASANDYINENPDIYDGRTNIAAHMMSVNLSLFGNMNSGGECTFDYFVDNASARHMNVRDNLVAIFNYYQFDPIYMHELEELTAYLSSSTGNLIQIFVPKELVDKFIYLSKPMGVPYNTAIVKDCFGADIKRHTKISPILERYIHKPHKIADLDGLQARILFLEPMFDPASGIKMFRYNTIAPENMRTYEQKLRDIVARMMADYVKHHKDDQHNTSPLFTLKKFVLQGHSGQ